jgi:hypothetical protein
MAPSDESPTNDPAAAAALLTARTFARAASAALQPAGEEGLARLRAQLRKEAVALDMRERTEARAAAAAIRQILDDLT